TFEGSSAERIDIGASPREILRIVPAGRSIFEKLGMTIAADQDKSLSEVCQLQGLDAEILARILEAFAPPVPAAPTAAVELMTLSELCDHCQANHHLSLQMELARFDLVFRTTPAQPAPDEMWFAVIRDRFCQFRDKLVAHLREEREVLFPLIRQLDTDRAVVSGIMDLLKVPLAEMKSQHNEVDEELAALEALTADDDSVGSPFASLRILREGLERLDEMLHGQIYQENQILFRRVSALGFAS